MSYNMTADQARELNARRTAHKGGRPRKPTECPVCGCTCAGYRLAQVHCSPGATPPATPRTAGRDRKTAPPAAGQAPKRTRTAKPATASEGHAPKRTRIGKRWRR